MKRSLIAMLSLALVSFACGSREDIVLDNDAAQRPGDGGFGGPCTATGPQCNNCVDDDGDGLTDGDDPNCAGPLDDDEGSFATGIPGDNKDAKKQDCFFDGDSGGSCQIDTCCLLSEDDCLAGDFGSWPPNDCAFDAECISECIDLTPPGCDCFGCCTICNPETGDCATILTNPAVSPDCDLDDIGNPETMDECVSCIPDENCQGGACDPNDCVLCPGQTEDDLPESCNNENLCPGDNLACKTTDDCDTGDYCLNSCCVGTVD